MRNDEIKNQRIIIKSISKEIEKWKCQFIQNSNLEYIEWKFFFSSLLASISEKNNIPTDQVAKLISNVTGFDVVTIKSLQDRPPTKRNLLIALEGPANMFSDLEIPKEDYYTKYAQTRMPDINDLDDYTYLYANIVFKSIYFGEERKKKIMVNRNPNRRKPDYSIKYCQDELKRKIQRYYLDINHYDNWAHFYQHNCEIFGLSNLEVAKQTGLDCVNRKEDVNAWNNSCPKKKTDLFLICTLFRYGLEDCFEVFKRFFNTGQIDLNSQSDLAWLYLIEHIEDFDILTNNIYRNLDSHGNKTYIGKETIDAVFPRVERFRKRRKRPLLEYYDLLKSKTFKVAPSKYLDNEQEDNAKTIVYKKEEMLNYTNRFVIVEGEDEFEKLIHSKVNIPAEFLMDKDTIIVGKSDDLLDWRIFRDEITKGAEEYKTLFEIVNGNQLNYRFNNCKVFLNEWMQGSVLNAQIEAAFPLSVRNKGKKDQPEKTSAITSSISRLMSYQYGGNSTKKNGNTKYYYRMPKYPSKQDLIFYGIILCLPLNGINELLSCFEYEQMDELDYTQETIISLYKNVIEKFYSFMLQPDGYDDLDDESANVIDENVERWIDTDNIIEFGYDPHMLDLDWSIRKLVFSVLVLLGYNEENWLYSKLRDGGSALNCDKEIVLEVKPLINRN